MKSRPKNLSLARERERASKQSKQAAARSSLVCETLNLSAANKKLPGPLGQEEEEEQKQKLHTQAGRDQKSTQ
jgi:hypothetical protein